ncbi:hypothetical protein Tco_0903767 [Tanacetum coccineum]
MVHRRGASGKDKIISNFHSISMVWLNIDFMKSFHSMRHSPDKRMINGDGRGQKWYLISTGEKDMVEQMDTARLEEKSTTNIRKRVHLKARKYIEKGCKLFLAQVTEQELKEKQLEDVPVIRGFPKSKKLYAKFSKYDFWLDSVQFLGHVIDSSGVHVDPAKIEAIKNWAAPTTPTDVRAPILSLPEGSEDFVVYCDALLKGFGARWFLLFDCGDIICTALSVRYTPITKVYNIFWIELLSDYDCVIRYHPGKANVVADAMSRKDKEPIRVRALVVTVHNNLREQIRNAQVEACKEEN